MPEERRYDQMADFIDVRHFFRGRERGELRVAFSFDVEVNEEVSDCSRLQ